ncbi:MAG: hypothetical protein O3A00_16675 [Planctomycetota bacterium]|nr:hypothetical protein [Planctomycetota bacterium]
MLQTENFELLVPKSATDLVAESRIWTPLDRRSVLRIGAGTVAGAAVMGGVPFCTREAEAGVPWIARAVFGAAIGWFLEKVLDRAYESRYRSQARLVARRLPPSGGSNRVHDQYASTQVVERYTITQRSTRDQAVEIKLSGHVYATNNRYRKSCARLSYYDFNPAELITFHKFYETKTWREVPLPVSCRVAACRRDQSQAESLLKSEFDNDPKAWKAEYTRRFAAHDSSSSTQTIGLASREDPQKKSLLVVQV